MVDISKDTQSLFYDPSTDSVDSLIHDIQETHSQILAMTDTLKGTLAPSTSDKSEAIR